MAIRTACLSMLMFVGIVAPAPADINVLSTIREVQAFVLDQPLHSFSHNPPGWGEVGIQESGVEAVDHGDHIHTLTVAAVAKSSGGIHSLDPSAMVGQGESILVAIYDGEAAINVPAQADSLLELLFEVTADGKYQLQAELGWLEDNSFFSGYSQLQLLDNSDATIVAQVSHSSTTPGTSGFASILELEQGITYLFRAEAHIFGGSVGFTPEHVSESNWSFRLEPIPEPAAIVLLSLGLGGSLPWRRPGRRMR